MIPKSGDRFSKKDHAQTRETKRDDDSNKRHRAWRASEVMDQEKVNILLVDDQPAKLLAYEVILKELGENLVVASSGREALEYLLKNEVAVILVDVCMPELDGFELAAMIREHPRFRKTAIIFISAIQVNNFDGVRA